MRLRADVIAVLGSRIGISNGKVKPALHTEMKIRAAGIAFKMGCSSRFILNGGYNFGVRYGLDIEEPAYAEENISEIAQEKARVYRSEASLMAEFMRKECGVSPDCLILEEDSRTIQENVEFCREIVRRLYTRGKSLVGSYGLGVLTLLCHMERALPLFQEEIGKIESRNGNRIRVIPFFAEDILVEADDSWIKRICEYYNVPRGGKQWDVRKIKNLLVERNSLAFMLKKEEKVKEVR